MSVLAPERLVEVPGAGRIPPSASGPSGSTLLTVLAAGCSLAAAAIHFGFAPTHFSEYWLHGAFFVTAGWAQLVCAGAVLVRPVPVVLLASTFTNAGVIVVWVISRRVGTLVGPGSSVPEPARFPDVLATVLEALVVVSCLLVVWRLPRLRQRARRPLLPYMAVGATLAVIAGSAGYALTPRFTRQHAHSDNTSVAAGPTDAGADHHATPAPAAALTGDTPCERTGPPASEGQLANSEGHNHRGPTPQKPIDIGTRLELQRQQEVARQVATRFPTVADAERGGYHISTVYVPCIGAHYTNVPLAGRFDPAAPSELLYDGTTPNARIVGLSYLVWHPGGAPEGFAGPNDVWHQHNFNGGLCINANGLVVGAESTSREECARRGGAKVPLTDIWMLHDWVVPGFECSWGVFAAECPELGGRLGGTAWDPPGPPLVRP